MSDTATAVAESGTSQSALPTASAITATDLVTGLVGGSSQNISIALLMAQILTDADFSTAVQNAAVSAAASDASYRETVALSAKIATFYSVWQAQIGGNGVYVDDNGFVKAVPANAGTLPADVTIEGGIYMAGVTGLPLGLSNNGGVIMTDDTVYYPGTYSNGGVLTVNLNATGA